MEGFKTYLNLDKEEGIELIKESVYYVRKAIELELGTETYDGENDNFSSLYKLTSFT